MVEASKFGSLFIALLFTFANVIKVAGKDSIPPGNVIFMSLGWTTFIYLQGWIG